MKVIGCRPRWNLAGWGLEGANPPGCEQVFGRKLLWLSSAVMSDFVTSWLPHSKVTECVQRARMYVEEVFVSLWVAGGGLW
jgi:hypothetical protein